MDLYASSPWFLFTDDIFGVNDHELVSPCNLDLQLEAVPADLNDHTRNCLYSPSGHERSPWRTQPDHAIARFHFKARNPGHAESSPFSWIWWWFHSLRILVTHSELALIWA
jgi:hypothetical protein